MRSTSRQPTGLISVLLDRTLARGDRVDAALDLGTFDEPEAEAALVEIALAHEEDPDIADEVGHSLWEIWKRKGKYDGFVVSRLHPEARKFFVNDHA